MPTSKFTKKKIFHSSSPSCILLSFSQNASRSFLTEMRTQFISRNIRKAALLVIYLFNYDSSKPTFFMLNMAFDVLSSTVFVKKVGILRFLQNKNYKNFLLFALGFDIYFLIKT